MAASSLRRFCSAPMGGPGLPSAWRTGSRDSTPGRCRTSWVAMARHRPLVVTNRTTWPRWRQVLSALPACRRPTSSSPQRSTFSTSASCCWPPPWGAWTCSRMPSHTRGSRGRAARRRKARERLRTECQPTRARCSSANSVARAPARHGCPALSKPATAVRHPRWAICLPRRTCSSTECIPSPSSLSCQRAWRPTRVLHQSAPATSCTTSSSRDASSQQVHLSHYARCRSSPVSSTRPRNTIRAAAMAPARTAGGPQRACPPP
mmetsp:Transcript_98052/g.277304  ORF Transcript_98052/g.277304 Transcript_98052/m.277304 type:complete len:263 (-) Transcript_98052:411-1199(-)